MIVLRIIGIVLAVLALGVAVVVLTLTLKASIAVRRSMPDGPLRVRVRYGPIKKVFTLGQRKKKPKQVRERQKTEQPKQQRAQSAVSLENLDIRECMDLAVDMLDDMTGAITWERLHVTVILHTDDAARTAILLGTLSALVGNLYPYMERAFVLRDPKIVLDADFDAQRTVWGVDIELMTRLMRFPPILWKYRKRLWALWKTIKT